MNETNALVNWYVKMANRQGPDRLTEKVAKYLRQSNVKAVPYDKGGGFCLMSVDDNNKRLSDVLSC